MDESTELALRALWEQLEQLQGHTIAMHAALGAVLSASPEARALLRQLDLEGLMLPHPTSETVLQSAAQCLEGLKNIRRS